MIFEEFREQLIKLGFAPYVHFHKMFYLDGEHDNYEVFPRKDKWRLTINEFEFKGVKEDHDSFESLLESLKVYLEKEHD